VKSDAARLQHVKQAIIRKEEYTATGREAFLGNHLAQDATIRQLEIIGEAVKALSAPLKDAHPEIPWRRIAGLRDVLIHDYFGVDLEAVWEVVEQKLPTLKDKITELLMATQSKK